MHILNVIRKKQKILQKHNGYGYLQLVHSGHFIRQ